VPAKLNKPHILGVLAGGDLPPARLAEWAHSAHIIIAADGAANSLNSLDILPTTTVGDFDSIGDSTKDKQAEVIHIPDQDSTDCDKLLFLASQRGYAEITLVGVEGDLLDHVVGNLFSAARSSLGIRLGLRRGIAFVLRGPVEWTREVPSKTRLSVMPLTQCSGVTIEGAKWPLVDASLSPLGLSSLSNQASGLVKASITEGTAVLFLAHKELERPIWD